MQKTRRNIPDIVAALTTGALGLYIVIAGNQYTFGTPRRMGPGFLPEVVGVLLVLLAAGLLFEALRTEPRPFAFRFQPVITVMLALVAFAVLIERSGMLPATFALVFLSALAEPPFRPLRTLVLAVAVSAMGIGIFIYGLGLRLPVLNW